MAALVAAAAGVGYLRRSTAFPDATSLQPELFLSRRTEGVFVSDISRLPHVQVLSAVDGDTLRVRWEGREERLRYYGVNTPEKGDACYEEATRRNAALSGAGRPGAEVLLAFDERARDKYGRLLAYVFTPEGMSIDSAIVAEGLGRAWTKNGRWRDAVEELEKEARREKRGCLWNSGSSTARGPRRARSGAGGPSLRTGPRRSDAEGLQGPSESSGRR